MEDFITPAETIDSQEAVTKALKKFEDHAALIVVSKGKYVGELHPSMLLRFKGDAQNVKIAKLARRGSIMHENELDLKNLIRRFSDGEIGFVTVLDRHKKPLGIVRAEDVLASSEIVLTGKKAEEYAEKVTFVDDSTPADKAEEMMYKNGVSELAVLSKNRFLGIVTARDIAIKIKPFLHKKLHELKVRKKIDVEKQTVSGILTPDFEIPRVEAGESVEEALEKSKGGEAFVFFGSQLIGKVRFSKILRSLNIEEPMHVEVSGLNSEEAMFKESIFEECSNLLRKFGKGGNLHLRIKSSRKGKDKKIYEVHGRLEIDGGEYVCSTPGTVKHRQNWDLGMVVSEVLKELREAYLRNKRLEG